MFFLYISSIVI